MAKPLPKETIQKIRREVLGGKTKYRVAKEMRLGEYVVYSHTSDLPSINLREPCIKGKTLDLLNELLKQGYVYSDQHSNYHLRRLKRFIPVVQRTQIEGKSIYYLDDKNKLALKTMITHRKSRIISYHDLANMSQVFGVDLSMGEKHNLLNRGKNRVFPIIRKKDGGFMSSLKKNQTKIDDFIVKNVFLGRINSIKHGKIHGSEEDSLLENGDSLVDFCIRKYCLSIS